MTPNDTKIGSLAGVIKDLAYAIKAPDRITVADFCSSIIIDIPGGYSGYYDKNTTPYFDEPMRCMTDRKYTTICFVGSAQTGKTQALVTNPILHNIKCDPHDALLIQSSEAMAVDYSERVLSRAIKSNPDILKLIKKVGGNMMYTKRMKSGAMINMGWPSAARLAGRAMRSVYITDLDRKPEISEGSVYLLAMNRIRSFMSRGLVVAESTPSMDLAQRTPYNPDGHEGPPVDGIFNIYNSGDMARYYLPCPECGGMFLPKPGPEGFWVPDATKTLTIDDRASRVEMICTANGCGITHKHKSAIIKEGVWVRQGQFFDGGGVQGEPLTSDIASFWLPGHAAAFQTWPQMMTKYLKARELLQESGKPADLKVCMNTDFGTAFQLPRQDSRFEDPATLSEREEPFERGVCPKWTRFITATVDIQDSRFVVQFIAWGKFAECQMIDRFNIRYSDRLNDAGERHQVSPRVYLEDWAVLESQVMDKVYYSEDNEFEFTPVLTGCDSMGGLDTTNNIALFYEQLRRKGTHTRFLPLRGDGRVNRRLITSSTLLEKHHKEKRKITRDVPLLVVNVNKLKDEFFTNLEREEPGAGYIHFGDWTPSWFYNELVAEARGEDGIYRLKKEKTNNEALDLFVYARAIIEKRGYFRINWDSPPYWAIPKASTRTTDTEVKKPNVRIDTGRFNRRARN